MCLPGCQEKVIKRLSRRRFFTSAGVTMAAGAAATIAAPPVAPAQTPRSFSRVVDLTHSLSPDFPTFFGEPQLAVDWMANFDSDGFNMARWNLVEHTGTHLDAPIHFSADGQAADEVPVENLVVPLAVVDIAAKAAENPDAQVTPEDIAAWEAEHGEIPQGACVAMYSGWGEKVATDEFRNADDDGVMHFPGFHADATQFLVEEREVVGIAVDTLSLDHGPSPDFAVHYQWLPTNRWGMECVANLADLPPAGATIVAGGPKIVGATGGPSRVIALV